MDALSKSVSYCLGNVFSALETCGDFLTERKLCKFFPPNLIREISALRIWLIYPGVWLRKEKDTKMEQDQLKKMKFSDEKKKTKKKSPQRPSIVSNYSFVSLSEVTEGSLQVWRTLPEKIRQDPSLASFRQEHERLHGE